MADLGDAGEVFGYLVGFWAFLFSPKYRAATVRSWREAGWGKRSLMLLEGSIATIVGLGLPLLVAWLLAGLMLRR
jgi:hypothetical protein